MNGIVGTLVDLVRGLGVADIVAVGGLVAAFTGIGFTLTQVLMLRRQLKLDALIRIMDSNRAIVALGFEHHNLWSAMGEGAATVLREEAVAHRRYRQLWLNHMQVMWSAWQLGLVSGLEWDAYRRDMGDFLASSSFRQHWTEVAPYYPHGFRRLIAELSPPAKEGKAGDLVQFP